MRAWVSISDINLDGADHPEVVWKALVWGGSGSAAVQTGVVSMAFTDGRQDVEKNIVDEVAAALTIDKRDVVYLG